MYVTSCFRVFVVLFYLCQVRGRERESLSFFFRCSVISITFIMKLARTVFSFRPNFCWEDNKLCVLNTWKNNKRENQAFPLTPLETREIMFVYICKSTSLLLTLSTLRLFLTVWGLCKDILSNSAALYHRSSESW